MELIRHLARFRQVALFADLPDRDLARICDEAQEVHLDPGDVLFHEGDPGDRAFVVVTGQLEIHKAADRRQILIAVRAEGEVIGEMALLEQEPRSATVIARTPCDLISIPSSALDDLLVTSPGAARSVFAPLIRRIRETNDQMRHQERMVQLGVLTAGVAHELNNPAAAVQRAAGQFAGDVGRLAALAVRRSAPEVSALVESLADRPARQLSPVEVADAEAAIEDWLDEHDVENPWEYAPALVAAGIGPDDLDALGESDDVAESVALVATWMSVRHTAAEVAEGARRLSEIVRVLRSYSYLDRAPQQEVDVVQGIEDTLMLLGHVVRPLRVVKEYADPLPSITALGSELNQVWTNLVHNAADALADTPDPTLTIRVRHDEGADAVVVEVEDNGPGIPADLQHKIFDAFFTTKPPGQGTGLGLQISYRIVVLEHRGDLSVSSKPGRTTFTATLPVHPPVAAAEQPAEEKPMEPCDHLTAVENTPQPTGGCEECLKLGDDWVHLRFCVTCEKIGCCNDSKNQHATKHFEETAHPVMRSAEPDENWAWCFVDELGMDLDDE